MIDSDVPIIIAFFTAIVMIFWAIINPHIKDILKQNTVINEHIENLKPELNGIKSENKEIQKELNDIKSNLKDTKTDIQIELNSVKSNIKNDIENVQSELNRIQTNTFLSAVSSQSYLALLTSEWDFWEKLFKNRKDKIAISIKIVDKYIDSNDQVIIDSGTTIDQIPRLLNQNYMGQIVKLKVYTNNIIAAISVIPPQFKVYILNGDIDEFYGATYYGKSISQPLDHINPSKIILAATLITFDEGPLVSTRDDRNKKFKKALIDLAYSSDLECVLIIAADWTKFIATIPPNYTHQCVLDDHAEWKKVRENNKFILCITEPPRGDNSNQAKTARVEIQKFIDNEKNQTGMKVVICGF
jgi:DeoR/GlpR family transcriptional regulator of sugar metabolism